MMRKSFFTCSVITIASWMALLVVQNVAIDTTFPSLARVTTNFSSTYLRRELRRLAQEPSQTIFLGDSVLWGYRLKPDQTAVAVLASNGCACSNLAFKKGSPANYYALTRLFEAYGVRPKGVVLEVNQKVFNPADSAYKTLHPAVAALAEPLFAADDRSLLSPPQASGNSFASRVDRIASSVSLLYAMRSDIREKLYGDVDAEPMKPLEPDAFEGTYDLTPLTESNVSVHYLIKTMDLLHASGISVLAFMTPTNHALLHEYIDAPEYRANGLFLRRLLERHGARVIDLDTAFHTDAFFDEVHLKPAAHRQLASLLARVFPK